LREKLEKQKIKKIREEIELMLCPYYGGGVRDTRRLEELLEELRERDALAAE
jgi:hypothetical protein